MNAFCSLRQLRRLARVKRFWRYRSHPERICQWVGVCWWCWCCFGVGNCGEIVFLRRPRYETYVTNGAIISTPFPGFWVWAVPPPLQWLFGVWSNVCCQRWHYQSAGGRMPRSMYCCWCVVFISRLLSSNVNSSMVPTRIILLDNLYLNSYFLTHSTMKKCTI